MKKILPLNTLVDPVTSYAEKVLSGDIVAGPHVRAACGRHMKDLKRDDLVFDIPSVERVVGFFRDVLYVLKPDEFGSQTYQPFELLPWQAFCVGSLFGWKRENGLRRFRVFFNETAKGSGKSPLLGGIGLYMMEADGEIAAEIYAAATKKDQAMILFRDAVAMVKASPPLKSRLKFSGGPMKEWNISDIQKGSFFRPISSDDGQSGPRPYGALVDEVHEHKDGSVIEMLEAGFKFRRNPILVMATNSGSDRTTVCWDYHDHGTKVCDGIVDDDEFFAYISALDQDDDPLTDRDCWVKANPSLGETIQMDYLESRVARAKAIPAKMNEMLRLNFCKWTSAENAWVTIPIWEKCQEELEYKDYLGKECYGGLDLSSKKDLTALSLAFPTVYKDILVETEAGGKETVRKPTFDVLSWLWTPKDTLDERESVDKVPYSTWVDGGHLIAPAGLVIDYSFVAAKIVDLNEMFDLRHISFDPHKIDYLKEKLEDYDAGAAVNFVEHSQGMWRAKSSGLWMPNSITELEDGILQERIRFKRNPVMTWNAMSAVFHSDEHENRKFDKRKAGKSRIDGIVAAAMSIGAATASPEAQKEYQMLVF